MKRHETDKSIKFRKIPPLSLFISFSVINSLCANLLIYKETENILVTTPAPVGRFKAERFAGRLFEHCATTAKLVEANAKGS